MMLNTRKALVTGATGFIGHHLANSLIKSGWEVTVIVRSSSSEARVPSGAYIAIHDGSTSRMLEIFQQAKPEVVFHLASKIVTRHSPNDIDALVDSNLRFGLQLLEAAVTAGCGRFINTGTGWQHYENQENDPVCLYAATKQAFEDLIEYYVRVAALKFVTLKLHDNYGEDDPRGKLMALLLKAARSGEFLDLSPGEQRIDLVNVRDVTTAFIMADEVLSRQPEAIHLRYMIKAENTISIRELAELITKITGRPVNARWGARQYREREVMQPSDRGEPVPGWKQTISLEQGIKEIWAKMK